MADKKKQKIRALFRKNRHVRARSDDWTRDFQSQGPAANEDAPLAERLTGKGDLTRKRTVIGETAVDERAGFGLVLDVDETTTRRGIVLRVHGLSSNVQAEDGQLF